MAAKPSSTVTVQDPGLGIAGSSTNIPVVIAYTSSGTANVYAQYTSINKLVTERAQGPGVEAVAYLLATCGGPVGLVTCSTSVAGSIGTVTQSGADTLLVAAGTPTNDYSVLVEIVAGGALGTATFKYTLDNFAGSEAAERTYSGTITVPSGGDYLMPNTGVTLTFADTQTAGNVHSFLAECPSFNSTDLDTAVDAVGATTKAWDFIVPILTQGNGDPTTAAGLAGALQAKLGAMYTASKYRSGMIATCRDDADPESDFAGVTADRLLIDYGTVRYISAKSFTGFSKPQMVGTLTYASRASGSLISTDLKRVPGNGINDGGPLPSVDRIFKDERVEATGLDDIKVSTLTTFDGRSGYFITQGRLKSAEGSDFAYWPLRRIMDVACTIVQTAQVDFIGRSVRTNNNGTIFEADALALEAIVQDKLDSRLKNENTAEGTKGHVSEVVYEIDRTNNINTTSTIISETSVRPRGYIDYVTNTSGFAVNVNAETEEDA